MVLERAENILHFISGISVQQHTCIKTYDKIYKLSYHSAQSVMNEIRTKPNINVHKFDKDHSSSSLHS